MKGTEIVTRTQRSSQWLYDRVQQEAQKTGNGISNEFNSLVLDGLRFREAKLTIRAEEK